MVFITVVVKLFLISKVSMNSCKCIKLPRGKRKESEAKKNTLSLGRNVNG